MSPGYSIEKESVPYNNSEITTIFYNETRVKKTRKSFKSNFKKPMRFCTLYWYTYSKTIWLDLSQNASNFLYVYAFMILPDLMWPKRYRYFPCCRRMKLEKLKGLGMKDLGKMSRLARHHGQNWKLSPQMLFDMAEKLVNR